MRYVHGYGAEKRSVFLIIGCCTHISSDYFPYVSCSHCPCLHVSLCLVLLQVHSIVGSDAVRVEDLPSALGPSITTARIHERLDHVLHPSDLQVAAHKFARSTVLQYELQAPTVEVVRGSNMASIQEVGATGLTGILCVKRSFNSVNSFFGSDYARVCVCMCDACMHACVWISFVCIPFSCLSRHLQRFE